VTPPTFAKLGVTDARIAVNLRIFLNSVPQHGVLEYDTKAGYLVRYAMEVLPGRTYPQIKMHGDEVVTERVEGIVEVLWRDEPV
jgi:hypothetical protein